jgi:Ca-activated chloride channel family protein
MTLVNPQLLTLLLAVPLLFWAFLASSVGMDRRGRIILGTLRILAVALTVLALARPATFHESSNLKRRILLLADGSLSIDKGELERARQAIDDAWPAAKKAGVLPAAWLFGRKPLPLENGAKSWDGLLGSPEWRTQRSGTDIQAALDEARSQVELGDGARVILLTDGNPTSGNLEGATEKMRRAQIPIFPLPLKPVSDIGVSIARLDVPERVFAGDSVDVHLRIQSTSSGLAHVRVRRDAETIFNESVALVRGPNVVTAKASAPQPGLIRFIATIDPGSMADRFADDNVEEATCQVQPLPRVLLVTDQVAQNHPLTAALKTQGVPADEVPPEKFPAKLSALSPYSCTIIDNVEAKRFPAGSLDLLEPYTRDIGGGFIMVGGQRSYAAGGYANTTVERILPVDMPTRSFSVNSGVVLLLDTSGSMHGAAIEVAKSACKTLFRLLKGRMVAMYAFSHRSTEIVPLQLIGDDLTVVDNSISRIWANGGTLFQPALGEAWNCFRSTPIQNRYVIMVTDGEPGDSYGLIELIDAMQAEKIKLSTVGIGNQVNPVLLQMMADHGGGRFHQPQNLENIASAFKDEASHIVEGTPIVEEPFNPRLVRPHPAVRGLAPAGYPRLTGYVGTTLKNRAEIVLASKNSDPVLATWRYGLGVTTAFTADVGGSWSADWLNWPDFARFWGQLVKITFRSNESDFTVRAMIRGEAGEVSVDAVDRRGTYLNFLNLFAEIQQPGDKKFTHLELPQREAGRYQNRFPATERGFYRVRVFRKEQSAPLGTTGAVMTATNELLVRPADTAALARMAAQTGGRVLIGPEEIASVIEGIPVGTSVQLIDWWTVPAVLALLLFLTEICLRRSGLFHASSTEVGNSTAGMLSVAESFLKMAKDFDAKGDALRAQQCYLKAHSFFLKAQREGEAKRMWERYRLMEERRIAK